MSSLPHIHGKIMARALSATLCPHPQLTQPHASSTSDPETWPVTEIIYLQLPCPPPQHLWVRCARILPVHLSQQTRRVPSLLGGTRGQGIKQSGRKSSMWNQASLTEEGTLWVRTKRWDILHTHWKMSNSIALLLNLLEAFWKVPKEPRVDYLYFFATKSRYR